MENTCAALVGVPFKDGGRGPSEGFGCWGLVSFVYALRGQPLEDYAIGATETERIDAAIEVNSAVQWEKVRAGAEEYLDVLTFRLDNNAPQYVTHVGVFMGDGRFLHSLQKTGVVLSRVSDPFWRARSAGTFRRRAQA